MLSTKHRFHGHGSLRFVYKNGQAIRSRLITIKYTTNPHRRASRYSVVVSKKVHKSAVGRNRIRRRVYEVIRHQLPKTHGVHDVAVLVFSSEVMTMPHEELEQSIHQLFEQAGMYQNH